MVNVTRSPGSSVRGARTPCKGPKPLPLTTSAETVCDCVEKFWSESVHVLAEPLAMRPKSIVRVLWSGPVQPESAARVGTEPAAASNRTLMPFTWRLAL